jgi:hypothetical protein
MSQPEIKAEKINSPIQLMAAWFVMLILLSGVLLTAAIKIEKPEWAAGYLVVSTTILILIVISAVILMLTKYRPHLQEGKEYAEWLKDQNKYGKGAIQAIERNDSLILLKNKFNKLKSKQKSYKEVDVISKIEGSLLYKVSVSNIEGAEKIIEAIQKFNVETELNEVCGSSKAFEDHQSIWLGSDIPADIAIPIIKKAITIWPHLKYIAFPSEDAPEFTRWMLYIGGSTRTAIERSFQPWTNEEINNFQEKDTALFHAEIRKKLP